MTANLFRTTSLIGLACTLVACVSAPVQPRGDVADARPPAPHEKLNAVLWMQTAAEYRASALQSYNVARMVLDYALADRSWTAATEQDGSFDELPPAIILDIDETVLDNSPSEARNILSGATFNEGDWNKWVSEKNAGAIPGAVAFTQYAREKGVTIFYISNRVAAVEESTRANLQRFDFPLEEGIDTILSKGDKPEWKSDKSSRRADIASRYRILLLVGDDFGDFSSAAFGSMEERREAVDRYAANWGFKWIVVPNPIYGSWERSIVGSEPGLTPLEQIKRKLARLNTAQSK